MSADTPVAQAVQAVQAKQGTETPNPASAPVEPTATQAQAPDPRMEALARKERQIFKMRKEIEAERESLKKQATDYETGYIPKSRLSEDPFGVLNELGLDYDKLTERLLAAPNMNDPAIKALMGRIKAQDDKLANLERQEADKQKQQYDEAIKQINSEVKQLVDSTEGFEMIKETGMHEAVVELIEQTYSSAGHLMDTSEACKAVEEHLLAEAEKLVKSPKLQSRLKPATPEQVTQSPSTQSQGKPPIKTLTNAVTAAPAKRLSDKERRERALAAFHGQLKG